MNETPLNLSHPAPGVARFTVPLAFDSPDHLHVHVLDVPDGPVIVDTGALGSEHALRAGLEALGIEHARVVITHSHLDHWGVASCISDTVLAHPDIDRGFAMAEHGMGNDQAPLFAGADQLLAAFEGFFSKIDAIPAVTPIRDGDRLGEWEVLHTPGHDPAHICLFRQSDGVLLCGDLLLPGFTPNVQPDWNGGDALSDFLDSVERVASLPVQLVLPAHGEPYPDARGRAAELVAHHTDRLTALRLALDEGVGDLDGLARRTFGKRASTRSDRMLARMETYAHLDYLQRRGHATCDRDGKWRPGR